MKIVPAKADDAAAISGLIVVLDTENYHFSDPEKIAKQIGQGWYYVAVDNDVIVGAMSIEHVEGSLEIYTLTSKLKGTGTKLIEFAQNYCRDHQLPKLWCWSLARYQANGFYEKMGFEERFLLKKQWYGEDCYLFGKVIT